MTELSERLFFTLAKELKGGDGAPELVQILPSGEVNPKGKTGFIVDEEARRLILSAFAESSTDLVVDYEHQSLSGSEAPAAGWIKEVLDNGEDGVWGRVQWTDRAREYLRNREYRYLSPVVLIRKKDGRAVELLGAALTNLPAIDGMAPVANTGRPLGGEEVRGVEDVCPTGYVPECEYESLKETLKQREAEAAIRDALAEGRITPPLVPWARVYAVKDPDGFGEFLKKACPVVPLKRMDASSAPALGAAQSRVNRLLGVGDETFRRYADTLS